MPRLRFGFLLVALSLSASSARAADELASVRADGAEAWRTAVPGSIAPSTTTATPLLAPNWFAKAPAASLRLAPEGSFDLASGRGKVLLLDFWASWCAPCLTELPHLQRLHAERAAAGLVAIAVNVDEGAAIAADAAKRLGLTMPIAVNDPATYRDLGVRTLPTLFVYDKQGRMRKRWDGYRPGLEKDIAELVDKLLADDPIGTTREVATVVAGQGRLAALWSRDLPGTADGVIALPPGTAGSARVVASGGDQLLSYDAAGEVVARVKTATPAGRLLDFGSAADGTREVVAYRPGATSLGVIALRSGTERKIQVPAPLLDLAVWKDGAGGPRRLAIATMNGAASAVDGNDRAKLLDGLAGVRSVVPLTGGGVLALHQDGKLGSLDASAPTWAKPAPGADRLLVAQDNGAVTAPRSVVAAVAGRFLSNEGRQLAVATYSGRVAVLDDATGKVLFDAVWSGVHDLAAADLDGDGRDELLVASGKSVTALGAVAH